MAMHGTSLGFSRSTIAAVLFAFLVAPPAAAQPPWQFCGDSGNFSQNSTYQSNLGLLSRVLPRNASTSPALFAAGKVGAGSDTVYALTLCRGDVDVSTCAVCAAVAFQDAQQLCAYSKEVTIYYDFCYLRFSDRDFLAGTDNDAMFFPKTENVSAPAAAFDAAVGALLNATADRAAADSTRRFATGEVLAGRSIPAIYALAQCTPDMSPAGCRSCLAGVIQMAAKYYKGSPRGRFIGLRCNYQYDLDKFFSSNPLLQLPAPASPPDAPPVQVPEDLAPPASRAGRKSRGIKIAVAVACSILLMLIILSSALICLKRRKTMKNQKAPELKKMESGKCAVFDLPTLQEATDNFHEKNKLGEGGFGTVYRGRLPDGQDIAVKKLSRRTRQGLNQLHNEVQVLAELKHKNLVRLQGFCSHREETMLVYERVKNGSLDKILFDHDRRNILNWEQKYNIILGIAKGILYLHEDSSIRIVHRDLKANNILLDETMNAKIADFGLARLLGNDHTQTKTATVAGTYGYMAPEYAVSGNVSPKIDIFSYGILVLEIITGRKNGGRSDESNQALNLLTDVWNCWIKGKALQLIDQSSLDGDSRNKVLRCIHIGLLCVQEHPDDRPSISSVLLMLTRNRAKLPKPRRPAFIFGCDSSSVHVHAHRSCIYEGSDVIVEDHFSVNNY